MISVPYHLGRRDVEVGRGPTRILESIDRPCKIVERSGSASDELSAIADVNTQLARAVAGHVGSGHNSHLGPPTILAGNCNSCLGTLAGLSRTDLGIVWFDAHGDFNTPATTISGALEGMSLAIATGSCHHELRQRIGLARPIPEASCVLVATRSLDPEESVRLENSAVSLIGLPELSGQLDWLAKRAAAVYLHLDLDVLDPGLSPGVNFSEPGGITADELYDAVRLIATKVPIAAATIANFNPDRDVQDRTLRIAQRLIEILP